MEKLMKRYVFLASCLFFFFTPGALAQSLDGRIGVGVNWPGFQVKYGFSEEWLGEAKVSLASNNTTAGVRVYRLFPEVPRMLMAVKPYLGTELDWVFSDYVDGGVLGGAFAGLEMMPTENLGIELDAGLYYQNLWSNLGDVVDVGIILNLGVTWFF
jgi:hypothetical protein